MSKFTFATLVAAILGVIFIFGDKESAAGVVAFLYGMCLIGVGLKWFMENA